MSEPYRVEVESCAGCPFTITEPLRGLSCRLDRAKNILSALTAPPRWCPLRRADHLVTLRVK